MRRSTSPLLFPFQDESDVLSPMLMTPFAVLRSPSSTVFFSPAPVTVPTLSVATLMSILPFLSAVPEERAKRAPFVALIVPPATLMSDEAASSAAAAFAPSASMSASPLSLTEERAPVVPALTTAVFAGVPDSARSLTVLPSRISIVTLPPSFASMAELPVVSAAMSRLPAFLTAISLPSAEMPVTGAVLLAETARSCPFMSMERGFAASLFVMAAETPFVVIVVRSFVKT